VSRKEGKKELSVICVEVVVKGTRGNEGTVVRGVGAPYRRVRIPGSSDLYVCEVSANKVIALRTRCFHLMIQQAIH